MTEKNYTATITVDQSPTQNGVHHRAGREV
jgi:hypothetical protein